MSRRVDSTELAELITHELDKYTDEVAEKIRSLGERIATEGKTMLQLATLPAESEGGSDSTPSTRRFWKKYAKNWSVQNRSGANFSSFYIHNKKTYRLTHLLENGHATRNGGRTRSFKHIAPVDEWCRTTYLKGVEDILEGKDNE